METVANLSGLKFRFSLPTRANAPVVGKAEAAAAPTDSAQISHATSPPPPVPTPAPGPQPQNLKKWTFLFYINGNNFLSKQAPAQLRMLEFAGSDDNINVAAEVAREKGGLDKITHDWSGVRRYEVPDQGKELNQNELSAEMLRELIPPYTRGINSKLVQELGNKDMASSQTLSDFVKWGMQKYPAEHTCLVMLGPSQGIQGIMHDDTSGHDMSPEQLKDALADAQKATGKKVDVLAFDASNATQAEMLYELKDQVKYVVGSEGLVAGAGMSVPSIVYELKKANMDVARTPKEVAQTFTMVGSMAVSSPQFTPTISAIDMSKVGAVKDALDNLGSALLKSGIDKQKLRAIIEESQEVGMPGVTKAYEGVHDATHFAKLLARDPEIKDAAVKTAAQQVATAVDDALVGEAHRGGAYRDANGISVFLPENYGFIRPDHYPVDSGFDHKFDYENLDFAKNSPWPKFLASIAQDSFAGQMATKVLGEQKVDKLVGLENNVKPTVQQYSSLASTIGWWESFNVLQGGRPSKLLFIPPTVAAYAGAYGGAYDVLNGVTHGVEQFKETRSYDAIVMNGLDVMGGVAKSAACISLVSPHLIPFAYAAGVFGFAKPWIQQAYGYFMSYKQIRDSIALSDAKSGDVAVLAANQLIHQHQYWDK